MLEGMIATIKKGGTFGCAVVALVPEGGCIHDISVGTPNMPMLGALHRIAYRLNEAMIGTPEPAV